MKPEIHPDYKPITLHCACGAVIETRSTKDEIHIDICSSCHPFYTGKQKLVDTAGRVERFRKKYAKKGKKAAAASAPVPEPVAAAPEPAPEAAPVVEAVTEAEAETEAVIEAEPDPEKAN